MKPRQPNERELAQRANLERRLAGRDMPTVDIDAFCPPHLPEDRGPAPVLLTRKEIAEIEAASTFADGDVCLSLFANSIEAAVLKKNGIAT